MKFKLFIVNLQLAMLQFFKSKLFFAIVAAILLAFFINFFTSNSKNEYTGDLQASDAEELTEAEERVSTEYKVTMGEVNRNSKLITYFFNELILQKTYEISGITEDYENVNDFDMQILDIKKTDTGFDVLVEISIRDEELSERVYKPFKRYLINVLSTAGGLKVDYISIAE